VLVYDDAGEHAVCTLFKIAQLRALGVTVFYNINGTRERGPVPDAPAVCVAFICTPLWPHAFLSYIIAPTAASVDAVRSDMRRNMCTLTICACLDCCLTLPSAGTGRITSTFFRGRNPLSSSSSSSSSSSCSSCSSSFSSCHISFLPFIPVPVLLPVKYCLSRQLTRILGALVNCWRSLLRMPLGQKRCAPLVRLR
jgi:hypothetical protein